MIRYIVWNEDKSEGFITNDKNVAYEVRKGADSNCFNREGERSDLGVSFCEIYSWDQDCTIEELNDKDDL